MERDCEHCAHHVGGSCDQWDCKFETMQDVFKKTFGEMLYKFEKDVRSETIDLFLKEIDEEDSKEPLILDMDVIEEIAEKIKGGE